MEVIYNMEEIDNVCQIILKNSKHKNLLFNGEMGAGKTTLISKLRNCFRYFAIEFYFLLKSYLE